MILYIYLTIINIIAAGACAYDKRQAVAQKQRISESNLLLLCILGGSVGMYLTMYLVHHKTRKPKFKFGVPLILILQIGLYVFYLIR